MKRFMLAVTCFIFIIGTSSSVFAVDAKIRIGGIYSNMTYSGDSGDVSGQEIFVIYSADQYWVVSQCAEGGPLEPVMVPAKETGKNTLEFTVTGNNICASTFKVTFQKKKALIEPALYERPLMKRHSYWH